MSDYQRMISAATVGFGAKPLPDSTFDVPVDGSVAAVRDAGDPVGSALRVAGLYAVARRAGQLPTSVETGSDPAPPETRPLITAAHAFLIERALTTRPILDGVLADIAAAGLRLPPRLIPELLRIQQSGVVTQELWEAIGNGGQWYAVEHYGRGHRALRDVLRARPTEWPKETDYTHGDTAKRLEWLATARGLDPDRARDLVARHWAEQTAISYPLASLRNAGAELRFGSDAPVADLDPWQAISAAVSRTDDDRAPWHPEETLTVDQAIEASVRSALRPGEVAAVSYTHLTLPTNREV